MQPEYNVGHGSAAKIAEDVKCQSSAQMQMAPDATTRPIVNESEATFFREHGYLIKRSLLTNEAQLAKPTDYMWSKVPETVVNRDDPASWTADPASKWTDELMAELGNFHGTNWKMRSRGPNGIGTEYFLVNEMANHPVMHSVAESFLGGRIKLAERVRGIYAIFPIAPDVEGQLGPHGDYMASELSAMVLVGDVPPDSGGFTVWPGSHQRMHIHWDRVFGSTMADELKDGYKATRDQIIRDTQPVEFTGKAGDVVFWHPRMIHSAGVNNSAKRGEPLVRVVIPVDYQRAGMTYWDDLEYGPGPDYQYWVDTRNYEEDVAATPTNMWDRWAI